MPLPVCGGGEELGARRGEWAKSANRFLVGGLGFPALGHQLFGAEPEVQRDLLLDLTLPSIPAAQRQPKGASNTGVNHGVAGPKSPFGAVRMALTVSAYRIQLRVSARRAVRPAAVSL